MLIRLYSFTQHISGFQRDLSTHSLPRRKVRDVKPQGCVFGEDDTRGRRV